MEDVKKFLFQYQNPYRYFEEARKGEFEFECLMMSESDVGESSVSNRKTLVAQGLLSSHRFINKGVIKSLTLFYCRKAVQEGGETNRQEWQGLCPHQYVT